ncbi:hypothetical protein ACOMHN_028763 [Nucella lapillus]
MGFRGRPGFLGCLLLVTTVLIVVYYAWNSYSTSSSKMSFSSVQGVPPSHLDKWRRQRQAEAAQEDPHIGLNKEIAIQVANEKWVKAKALQDHIDEERIAEEQAAQYRGKDIDNVIKTRKNNAGEGRGVTSGTGRNGRPLLFRPAEPSDGDYFSRLERIVHLDLKGAPPLVSYLERLFPLLRDMGATGILMEYEDMFPYSGNLSMLASAGAYSQSDLQRIQEAAKLSRLEIIPLVQTFGHMEFVLKFKQFIDLREHDYTPQVITPVREASYVLIFQMLQQVLKAHPDARRIHLGCDEVYRLGDGQSNPYMTSHRLTPEALFLQHVTKVAHHLKRTFPKVQSLIWDDWLRSIPYDDLADSGLAGLVEPVVWYYQHDITDRVPAEVWENYSRLFTGGVWVASAFKGATAVDQMLTNASTHLDNSMQWVSVMRHYGAKGGKVKFRGTVLTGWQRYDHFATLCELLPVGLPSLALCLQAFKNGGFGLRQMGAAARLLKCTNPLDLEYPEVRKKEGVVVTQDCRFPGQGVYYRVQQLWGALEGFRRDRGLQQRISGHMTDHHLRLGISNPGQMKVLVKKLEKVMHKVQEVVEPIEKNLLEMYDKWTVDEWVTVNIIDKLRHFNDIYLKAKKFMERREWPARPFLKPSPAPTDSRLQTGGGGQVGASGQKFGPEYSPQNKAGQAGQWVSGRMQINPSAQDRPGSSGSLHRSGNLLQGMETGQRQSAGGVGTGGLQPGLGGIQKQQPGLGVIQKQQPGLGVIQKQSGSIASPEGGVLSQTLLKKPGQGYIPGRPSGPSKMQRLAVQNGHRQPFGTGQAVGRQNAEDQQKFGQYVPGLSLGQKQPPSGPSKYMRYQIVEAPRANQYDQQNQGRIQNFNGQQGPNSPSRTGLRQKPQRQNQPDLLRRSEFQLPQGGFRQQDSLLLKGPQSVKKRPAGQQQLLSSNDLKEKTKTPEKKKVYEPQGQLHTRDNEHPDYKNDFLKRPGSYGEEKDAGVLDSFVGRRGKNEKGTNGNEGDKRKEGKDYNADDDDTVPV